MVLGFPSWAAFGRDMLLTVMMSISTLWGATVFVGGPVLVVSGVLVALSPRDSACDA